MLTDCTLQRISELVNVSSEEMLQSLKKNAQDVSRFPSESPQSFIMFCKLALKTELCQLAFPRKTPLSASQLAASFTNFNKILTYQNLF